MIQELQEQSFLQWGGLLTLQTFLHAQRKRIQHTRGKEIKPNLFVCVRCYIQELRQVRHVLYSQKDLTQLWNLSPRFYYENVSKPLSFEPEVWLIEITCLVALVEFGT